MNKIRHIDPENMLITVEPGITRKEVNEALRDTGLFFSVDPGAMRIHRRHGRNTGQRYNHRPIRHHARCGQRVRVVLADGRIIKTGTYAKKHLQAMI